MQIECEPRFSDSNPTYYFITFWLSSLLNVLSLPCQLDIGLDSALV